MFTILLLVRITLNAEHQQSAVHTEAHSAYCDAHYEALAEIWFTSNHAPKALCCVAASELLARCSPSSQKSLHEQLKHTHSAHRVYLWQMLQCLKTAQPI